MTHDSPEDPKSKTPLNPSGTQVDLGEDLISSAKKASQDGASASVEDELQSARILYSEGLNDDAKRLLRRILISDPRNATARQALQAIQDQELKDLLEGGAPERFARTRIGMGRNRRASARKNEARKSPGFSPEKRIENLIMGLDQDLKLGLELQAPMPEKGDARFLSEMESSLLTQGGEPRGSDRLDLGIAYFEMGHLQVAEHQFREARKIFGDALEENPSDPLARKQWISSCALLAHTLLAACQWLEGLKTLQETLTGLRAITDDFQVKENIELYYLMGRAAEGLGQTREAIDWYLRVNELDPAYRDSSQRSRFLSVELAGKLTDHSTEKP